MPACQKATVAFITGSAEDWGGASRVIFTFLRQLPRARLDPLLLFPSSGRMRNELAAAGMQCRIFGGLTEPTSWLAYLRAFFRAVWVYRRERVRLIHANHSGFWRAAEILAARVSGIPVVVHYHVVNDQPSPAMAWCRAIIAVSDYVKSHSGPADVEKFVIRNPVDPERFASGVSLRQAWGLAADSVVVSFAGQIREIKGVQDFIAMARGIPDERAVFIIAGECRDPARFPGSYSEADLTEMISGDRRIRYVGYLQRVEDLYASSDVVVVPSRWQEPLGLIALEAGASGKPVVATRVGGIPEVIVDGQTGFLVDLDDGVALAGNVARLIDDPALRASVGKAAYQHVIERFTTEPVSQFEDLLVALATE